MFAAWVALASAIAIFVASQAAWWTYSLVSWTLS
jgi:hypothetical protein